MPNIGIKPGTVLQIRVGQTPMTARVRRILFRGSLPLDADADAKDEVDYDRVRDLDIFESSRGAIVIRRRVRQKGERSTVEWRVCKDDVEAAGSLNADDPLDGEALRECDWFALAGAQEV